MIVIDSKVVNIDELSHGGEEEMFLILKGTGTLRYGDDAWE